jgi:signal transduction histidine kinase/HAMP domain-containing protein
MALRSTAQARKGEAMSRFSIRTRLIVLAAIGLVIFLGTSFFLTQTLVRNTRSLTAQTEFVEVLETTYRASKEFDEMKYWLADLAVSLLMNSEQRAETARRKLDDQLDRLGAVDPAAAAAIRTDADQVLHQSMVAVEAYSNDQRVLGNSLMAPARAHIQDADKELTALVTRLREESRTVRDAALAQTERTLNLALAVVALAVAAGLVLTTFLMRSISLPLGKLVTAMDGITAGDLHVDIPPAGKDEIGAMSRTLALFRDSLIERNRLSEERDVQRRMIETAVETITDGFVLWDSDDQLVLCNSKFREFYAGLQNHLRPGVSFEEIVGAALDLGLHDLGGVSREAWLARRYKMHSKPSGSHTHHHNDNRWIRVTERRTPDGGMVAVYTDISELKEHEQELRQAKEKAERALQDLKQAQNNLVQAEKLALLGQLVAGIAHEIKNPLNFINNFSELSVELLDELKDALTEALPHLDEKVRDDVDDLIATLTVNLDKIHQHGDRADSIVKSMLAHSREGAGERRLADINDLVEESLNLAYHGARAQDQGFNISLERTFDPSAGAAEVVPQDLSRVLLNLFSNGFYATQKRKRDNDDPAFQPTLNVATRRVDGAVEIRVRDNGTGIPKDVVDKIFTPFFTTKPAGEGTGLGLSLSYDIVVHQHNGTFDVDTREGEYTEFIVSLPCAAGDLMQGASI